MGEAVLRSPGMRTLPSAIAMHYGCLAGDFHGRRCVSQDVLCFQRDFQDKWTRDFLSMNQCKRPLLLGFRLSHTELRSAQTASSIWAETSASELQRLCKGGELDSALDVLLGMDQQGTVPSVKLYGSLLKACSKKKALGHAKKVHAHLAQHGLETTTYLGEDTVIALIKCGGLEDALQVFYRLSQRTVYSWTAAISGYSMAGQCREALQMYRRMKLEGVEPNTYTFVSLLKACSKIEDIEEGKWVHAEVVKYSCESDLFVRTCLVDMYAKCGSLLNAQRMFDGLSQRDVVSWTALLSAYVEKGLPQKALQLYKEMREEGVSPNNRTLVTAVQACGMLAETEDLAEDGKSNKVQCLELGRLLHADARKKGYDSDVFVGSTLVSMYGKCGSIEDAQNVFDELSQRNVVSWTAMLGVYVEQGQTEKVFQLYGEMRLEGVLPDARTFATLLHACSMLAEKEEEVVVDGSFIRAKSLVKGKSIHADAQSGGYDLDVFVGNTLVSMYGKCGSIVDAQSVFNRLFQRDVVLWNAMLVAYVQQGQADKALHVYEQMLQEGVDADSRTFVSMLQACSMLAEREECVVVDGQFVQVKCLQNGKLIHADARRKGYESDVFIASTLISMYGKCGSIINAQNVFDGLQQTSVVAWTAMLAAYVEQGNGQKALLLFTQMEEDGVSPNNWTFVSALQACSILGENEEHAVMAGWTTRIKSLQAGKAIHAGAWKKNYRSDIYIGNALIGMYGKCRSLVDAQNVFEGMFSRDVVSWNAMVTVYSQHGQSDKALLLYRQMEEEGTTPNEVTLICILQACSDMGNLDICRQIHHTKHGSSPLVARTLINAYGRCASIVDAQTVFDALVEPDVVSWTTLLAAYARQGDCAASLQCYADMLLAGVKPDGVTFLSILSACSHAGLVKNGVEYFESMTRDHGITPELEHYASMVDLLGRAGYFTELEQLLSTMPREPDLVIWLCLLGACRNRGMIVLGEYAFEKAMHLEPKHSAAYVLMWNTYADAGLWDQAKAIEELRETSGACRKPGQSWIDYGQEVHTFAVADCKHPLQKQLYDLLKQMNLELMEAELCSSNAIAPTKFLTEEEELYLT